MIYEFIADCPVKKNFPRFDFSLRFKANEGEEKYMCWSGFSSTIKFVGTVIEPVPGSWRNQWNFGDFQGLD